MCFIDNEAARHSPTRASARTMHDRMIVSACLRLEDTHSLRPWYSRVPTASNIADPPSRLEFDEMRQMGAEFDEVPWGLITPCFESSLHSLVG